MHRQLLSAYSYQGQGSWIASFKELFVLGMIGTVQTMHEEIN
jgi:hypothetical protein